MQRKSSGQTFTEYCVVIALIGLACIPVIMLLGSNVQSGVTNLIPGATVGSQASYTYTPGPAIVSATSPSNTTVQAVYNGESNNLNYDLVPSSGGGTNTASVDGHTKSVSAELIKLASTWRDASGKPLDDDIRDSIITLANSGYDIAEVQGEKLTNDSDFNESDMMEEANDFADDYNDLKPKLEALIKQSPEYADLKKIIDQYSGIISSVNYDTFINGSDSDNGSSTEDSVIVGTKPAVETKLKPEDVPVITATSAGGIEATAK